METEHYKVFMCIKVGRPDLGKVKCLFEYTELLAREDFAEHCSKICNASVHLLCFSLVVLSSWKLELPRPLPIYQTKQTVLFWQLSLLSMHTEPKFSFEEKCETHTSLDVNYLVALFLSIIEMFRVWGYPFIFCLVENFCQAMVSNDQNPTVYASAQGTLK